MSERWKSILQWPGQRRGAAIQILISGAVSREDLENVGECLAIALRRWPADDQLDAWWVCPACDHRTVEDKLVPIFSKGAVGCPNCGGQCVPLIPQPAPSAADLLEARPSTAEGSGDAE